MASLQAERRRRAQNSQALQQGLYRREIQAQAQLRVDGQRQAAQAEHRIAQLLPMAVQVGVTLAEISRLTGISRPTLYKMLDAGSPSDTARQCWQHLTDALVDARSQLHREPLRDEIATQLGIAPQALVSQLLTVAPHALELAQMLRDRADLFEALQLLPKPEGTFFNQALFQMRSIVAIAESAQRTEADVMVHLTLAVLRLVTDFGATKRQ
jgi:hypothetical protein